MSSSTTTALSRQPLAQVLKNVEDPRDRRGVRHSLFAVLSLAVTGVLAGCRSLTAIWEHATGAVLTPERVAGKSNEIPALRVLLEPLDLNGVVVTADAMHTQADTAQWIRGRGGHYLLTVKDNQPGLKRELEKLPWKDVPSISVPDGSHGRRVRRTIKAVEAPARVDFPGAAQDDPPPATWTGPGRPRPGSRHRYGW